MSLEAQTHVVQAGRVVVLAELLNLVGESCVTVIPCTNKSGKFGTVVVGTVVVVGVEVGGAVAVAVEVKGATLGDLDVATPAAGIEVLALAALVVASVPLRDPSVARAAPIPARRTRHPPHARTFTLPTVRGGRTKALRAMRACSAGLYDDLVVELQPAGCRDRGVGPRTRPHAEAGDLDSVMARECA